MMWNRKTTTTFLIIYLGFLFLTTFFIVPTITSFYYYAWGKHLAWSYFDGPPMIAYIFHISHAIFNNTFFSINIVGLLCLLLGAFYIYKIGCLLQNQQTGLISALIWMALPTTVESVFIRVLYDAPLNLFTIMSFYYFARYISPLSKLAAEKEVQVGTEMCIKSYEDCHITKRFFSALGLPKKSIAHQHVIDLYFCAFFVGAMILSKYTAIVSILGMFFYVIFSKQRQLIKIVHFYLASLVVIIMALPVIYWNTNHHWISISYLLNFHSQAQNNTTIMHACMALLMAIIINYSVFLLLALLGWYKYRKTHNESNNPVLEFIYTVLFVGLAFWFLATLLGGSARVIYLTPLGINIALATGYTINQYRYERFFMVFYPLFLLISIIMIVANSWPIATYLKKGVTYAAINNLINRPDLLKKGQPLVTGYYTNAAALSFFMPNEPIYAIPCDDINQYQYWNASFLTALDHGKIDKISYIDFKDTKQCAERFFNKCHPTALLSHYKKLPIGNKSIKPIHLYVYECSLPRKKV